MAKKHFETIIILLCVLAFFIFTPVLLFYALGYRYSLDNRRIVKTGGVFLSFSPDTADVYIDGLPQQKRYRLNLPEGFRQIVQGENLLPGNHRIKISLTGYGDWEKEIRIEESKVAVIENVLLLPDKFDNAQLASFANENIGGLAMSPKQDRIAFEVSAIAASGSPAPKNPAVWFVDLTGNTPQMIADNDTWKKLFGPKNDGPTDIDRFLWSPDETKILYELDFNGTKQWAISDIASGQTQLLRAPASQKPAVNGEMADPLWASDSDKILFLKNNVVYTESLRDNLSAAPLLTDVASYGLKENYVYWLSHGLLYRTNLSRLLNKENDSSQLSDNSLPESPENSVAHIIISEKEKIFAKNAQGTLYYLDAGKIWKKIADRVGIIKVSPDGEAIAYSNDHEIWVYYLNDKIYLEKTKNSAELITRYSDDISYLEWLDDSEHLLFRVGNQAKITEIDSRDYRQISNLGPENYIGEMIHKSDKDMIYFVNSGNKTDNLYKIQIQK